jgi:hypothetical protein
VLRDQRIDHGARLDMRSVAVVGGQRPAVGKVAHQREIDGAPSLVEGSAHLDAQQPRDAVDLTLERRADACEIGVIWLFQPPQHDMSHHRR